MLKQSFSIEKCWWFSQNCMFSTLCSRFSRRIADLCAGESPAWCWQVLGVDFWVVQFFCSFSWVFDVFVRGLMFFGWVLYCLICFCLDFDVLLPIFLVFLCWVVEAFDGFSMFLCGVFDVNVCLMLVAGFFILCSFVYILYIPYVSICVLGVSCVFFFFCGVVCCVFHVSCWFFDVCIFFLVLLFMILVFSFFSCCLLGYWYVFLVFDVVAKFFDGFDVFFCFFFRMLFVLFFFWLDVWYFFQCFCCFF